jgi:hypothetical protein
MAQVTRDDVYVDAALSQFSVGYKNTSYIADQILPVVRVNKPTGLYYVYDKASWFRDEAAFQAAGTRAHRGGFDMSSQGTYTCLNYAFATPLPNEIRDQADDALAIERTSVEFATDMILRARERRVANALFNATTFSGYTAAAASLSGGTGVQWSTVATSDPIFDIEVTRKNIIGQIGMKPNVMIVGEDVHSVLRVHPAILEAVKYTSAVGVVPDAELARLFDVDKYLVGTSLVTTSEEGVSATYSFTWGKYCLLAYIAPNPSLMSPSLGYVIQYGDRKVERFVEDQEHQQVFAASECVDEVIVSAQSGYLLSAAVA